jgi:hypothetical protein
MTWAIVNVLPCKTTFIPKTAAKRRGAKPENPMKMPLIFGGVLLVAVVALFALSGPSKKEEPKPTEPEKNWFKTSDPQYMALQKFQRAVADRSEIGLFASLSLPKHYDLVHRGTKPVAYKFLPQNEKQAFQEMVKTKLFEEEEGKVFREFEPTTIERKEMPKEDTGAPFDFSVDMAPIVQNSYADYARVRVWTIKDGLTWKVLRWKLLEMPKAFAQKESGSSGKKERPKGVSKPKLETIDVGGKKVRVEQSKVAPLGHLEGTSPELQRKIDAWIEDLMDSGASSKKLNTAMNGLVEAGKPSIPRLLNKFYETRGSSSEEIEGLGLVARTLRRLSGDMASFGYNPQVGGADSELYAKMREKAMKSWYAWWYRNFHREEFPPPLEEDPDFK